jgi:fatty acid desaturase
MAVAPRARPEDFFSAEEWGALSARSRWRGLWLVAHCWAVIGAAMLVGTLWPVTIPLAIVVIGTRQLGLFVLMHDGAHALLHRDRRVNDWVADWLCSFTLKLYRPYHLQHHRYVQQTEDPDLVLSAPFPITRTSFARKVARDLTGQTFVKQRFGHYRDRLRSRAAGESAWALMAEELAQDRRFLLGNALGFAAFAAAGLWWVWLTLWLLPMATWLPLVSRIRNIAEHALVRQNEPDPLRQARTTHANLIERVLVAPYWVNYHAEHHLFTQVACWNLPKAHRMLAARRATAQMETERGYLALLGRACAGTGTAA